MIFRRRTPQSWFASARRLFYPEGGIRRAVQYVLHRMRRLPDSPQKVARGVAAGMFVNFLPLIGVQMLSAVLLALAMRGNVVAALLATLLSNPLTTPLIAVASIEIGNWMLGIDATFNVAAVLAAFADAGLELWRNLRAFFAGEPTQWESLGKFFRTIYLPYFVGSLLPAIVFAVASYFATVPLVAAYQRLRARRMQERIERRLAARAAALAEAEARRPGAGGADTADGGDPSG